MKSIKKMRIFLKGKYYHDKDRIIFIASKEDKENKSISNVYITVPNQRNNILSSNMKFELKSEGHVPPELKISTFNESDMKKICDIIDNWADDIKLDMLYKYSDTYNLL
jgi:hypothetical protein